MAYSDDQAEIDSMSQAPVMGSSMANMDGSYDDSAVANEQLNNNISGLRSAVSTLSEKIVSLSRSTFEVAKQAASGATKEFNVDKQGAMDRMGAVLGGPIGLAVSKAIGNSGIADRIGSSVRDGMGRGVNALGSKFKSIFSRSGRGGGYDSQSGFLNPASMSKIYSDGNRPVIESLNKSVAAPLIEANNIANQELEETRTGNKGIVTAVEKFNRSSDAVDHKIYNAILSVNDTVRNTNAQNNQQLIGAINQLGEKFTTKADGFAKGAWDFVTTATKIGTLFKGKYTNDIAKSNNPLETQVSALLQIYRWQRLYGELSKKQLNELIKLQGGDQKDVVGKHGLFKEMMIKNSQAMSKMLGDGFLGKAAKFLTMDLENIDDRNRASMQAAMEKRSKQPTGDFMWETISSLPLIGRIGKNKLHAKGKKTIYEMSDEFDGTSGVMDSAKGNTNITYRQLQELMDAQASKYGSFKETNKVAGQIKKGYKFTGKSRGKKSSTGVSGAIDYSDTLEVILDTLQDKQKDEAKKKDRVFSTLDNIRSDTSKILVELYKSNKSGKGTKKDKVESLLTRIADSSEKTAEAEDYENKELERDQIAEEKRKKKEGVWNKLDKKDVAKQVSDGIFGKIGKFGSFLFNHPLLVGGLIAALMFPNATKGFAKWMFGGVDRFAKGLTVFGKAKKAIKGAGAGIVKGAAHMGKVTAHAAKYTKSAGGIIKGIKAGAKTLGVVKFARSVAHLTKAGNGLVKSVGAVVGRNIGKTIAKGGLKAFAKRIPIVGSLLSVAFAIARFKKGEIRGGLVELLSGGLGLLDLVAPGLGSALSLATDFLNIWLDNKADKKKAQEAGKKSTAEKVKEVKNQKIGTDKKNLSENAKKAQEHAKKGNKLRAGYYGYKASKDIANGKGESESVVQSGVVNINGQDVKDTYKYGVKSAGNFVNAATALPRETLIGTAKGVGHVAKGALVGTGQILGGALKGVGQAGWGAIKGTGQALGGAAKGVGQAAWGITKGVGQAGWGALKGAGQAVAGIGKGIWNGGVKGVGGGLIDILKGDAEKGIDRILKGMGTVCTETLKGLGKGTWSLIKGVGKGAWSAVSGLGKGLWSLTKGLGKGLWSVTKGIGKGAWSLVKGTAKGLWSAAKGAVKGIGAVGKGIVKGAWGLVSGTAKGVWNLGKAVAALPYNIAKGTVKGVVNTVKTVGKGIKKVWGGAKAVGKGIWGFMTGKYTAKEAWNGIKSGIKGGSGKGPQGVAGAATKAPQSKEEREKEYRAKLERLLGLVQKNPQFNKEYSTKVPRIINNGELSNEQKFKQVAALWKEFRKGQGVNLDKNNKTVSGTANAASSGSSLRDKNGNLISDKKKTTAGILGAGALKIAAHTGALDKGAKFIGKYVAGSKLGRAIAKSKWYKQAAGIGRSWVKGSKRVGVVKATKGLVKGLGGKALKALAATKVGSAVVKGAKNLASYGRVYKQGVKNLGFFKATKAAGKGLAKRAWKGITNVAKAAAGTKLGKAIIGDATKIGKQGWKAFKNKGLIASVKKMGSVANIAKKGKAAIGVAKTGFTLAKTVMKGGLKTLMSGGLKSGLKAGAKGLMKGGLKGMLKKIPILGGVMSLFFAFQRFKKGEWGRGIIELLSGVASCIPGIGTGISIVLDILNMFLDAKMSKAAKETDSVKPPPEEKKEKKGPGFIKRFMMYFNKAKDHWKKGNYLRAIGWGMAALAAGNPITGGITHWFMKKLGVAPSEDNETGSVKDDGDKKKSDEQKAEEERKKAEEKKKQKIEKLKTLKQKAETFIKEHTSIFAAPARAMYKKLIANYDAELKQLGYKEEKKGGIEQAAKDAASGKTDNAEGVNQANPTSKSSQMTQDIKETNKLEATNKVYAHKKANEQLNNSINDSTSKTTNAIINNGRSVSNSISRVNNTIINNNNTSDTTNDSMYVPTAAVSGANV